VTIRYCDFCGEVIPEGEGDPIMIGNPDCNLEACKDACTTCYGILWEFAKNKNLRSAAVTSAVQSLASQRDLNPRC
jgi:ribosomal protein L24E